MKTITLVCNTCGNSFEKPLNEYKRKIKLGKTEFFCNMSCSGKRNQNVKMIMEVSKPYHFKGGENKILSEDGIVFRAMKEFSRRIRRRKKFEKEILPEELLKIWKSQNGKCLYTNVNLILPFNSEYNKVSKNYKASLDRIDSLKPYSIDNIAFVSVTVNNLKNDMNASELDEFFSIIK